MSDGYTAYKPEKNAVDLKIIWVSLNKMFQERHGNAYEPKSIPGSGRPQTGLTGHDVVVKLNYAFQKKDSSELPVLFRLESSIDRTTSETDISASVLQIVSEVPLETQELGRVQVREEGQFNPGALEKLISYVPS